MADLNEFLLAVGEGERITFEHWEPRMMRVSIRVGDQTAARAISRLEVENARFDIVGVTISELRQSLGRGS